MPGAGIGRTVSRASAVATFPLASRAVNSTSVAPTSKKLGASVETVGCGSAMSVTDAPLRNSAAVVSVAAMPPGVVA